MNWLLLSWMFLSNSQESTMLLSCLATLPESMTEWLHGWWRNKSLKLSCSKCKIKRRGSLLTISNFSGILPWTENNMLTIFSESSSILSCLNFWRMKIKELVVNAIRTFSSIFIIILRALSHLFTDDHYHIFLKEELVKLLLAKYDDTRNLYTMQCL